VKRRRFLQHCAATAGGLIVPGLVLPEIARPANVALHLSPQPGGGGGTPEGPATNELWMTVETTTASESFTIPTVFVAGTWDATIDWGDGNTSTITAFNDPDFAHTYATAGEYLIKITGQLGIISYNANADALKIKAVQANNSTVVRRLGNMFDGASNLVGAFPTFDGSVMDVGESAADAFKDSGLSGPLTTMDWSFASTFNYAFSETGITAFDSTQPLTATVYNGAFYNCADLVDFGANLFDALTTVDNYAFYFCWKDCSLLSAQSVENILISIAYACDNNGLVAPVSGNDIRIDYDTGTGSLSSATTTAIATCKTAGFTVRINGTLL
jgi:hypothetical protein